MRQPPRAGRIEDQPRADLEDAHALTRQLPDARFIEARSILELRTKPDRLYPEIVGFLRAVEAQEAGASKSAV